MGKSILRITLVVSLVVLAIYTVLFSVVRSPVFSKSSRIHLKERPSSSSLKTHVEELTNMKMNRSVHHPDSLIKAAQYIEESFVALGYKFKRQNIPIEKLGTYNIVAEFVSDNVHEGSPMVVVGAHYDVAGKNNPGADDNASGVAGLIELARMFKKNKCQAKYPIQFVAYSTEEPPFFAGRHMGSAIHSQALEDEKQNVRLMYSLEMIGYYSDQLFSQKFPVPILYTLYPWRGNFIGLVGNMKNVSSIKEVKRSFLAIDELSTYSISAPKELVGIDFSDHRNYWEKGWPAIMVTDTAFFRNEEYHKPGDTADRLDYNKMALVVSALFQSICDLK